MASQGIPFSKIENLKEQWLAMIDAIVDPLVIIDQDYNIIRQNKAYFKKVKCKEIPKIELVPGKTCFKVFAKRSSPCEHCLVFKSNSQKKTITWNTTKLFKNKVYEIQTHQLKFKQIKKNDCYFVIHYKDVSQQNLMQKNLAFSDKLAAIGQLAGGVAHEINSPLAGILAFAQILLSEIPKENPHREDIEQIEIAAKKCKEIVENLLSFARHDQHIENKTKLHVLEEVKKTVQLAKGLLAKKEIQVIWEILDDENDIILGNAGQIGQIFLNLINNAIQAMNSGGALEIEKYTENDCVCISIKDTGKGIPPDIIHKIFEPFFTTKEVGQGTGLGLSISYSLIKQHGGDISVISTMNEGSDFTVKFPLAK